MQCPKCSTEIHEKALVRKFLEEPEWDFWGHKGFRWIVCQHPKFTHFKVELDGNIRHRLAQVSKKI